jgi:hypothetical protein
LFNGNSRTQTFDRIHLRPVHPFQKLAGVGRERFHIAPLTFSIKGVEGEGGFARATDSGDYHQAIPGDLDINIFEVVLSGTENYDLIHLAFLIWHF